MHDIELRTFNRKSISWYLRHARSLVTVQVYVSSAGLAASINAVDSFPDIGLTSLRKLLAFAVVRGCFSL